MSRAVIPGRRGDECWGAAISVRYVRLTGVVCGRGRITPDEVVVVRGVVVAPHEVLPLGRVDVVAPDQVLAARPVGDVAEENALGREDADRVGQPNQVQLAPRELIRVEQD